MTGTLSFDTKPETANVLSRASCEVRKDRRGIMVSGHLVAERIRVLWDFLSSKLDVG